LPFGLKNAPGEFQLFIERILAEFVGDEVTVHLDDILIYSLDRDRCAAVGILVASKLKDERIRINTECRYG
jgi:hypothetical protein